MIIVDRFRMSNCLNLKKLMRNNNSIVYIPIHVIRSFEDTIEKERNKKLTSTEICLFLSMIQINK